MRKVPSARGRPPVRRSGSPSPSILVIDEETAVRKLMSATLRQNDYAVEDVGSHQQALEALSLRAFDLVISDLRLSGVDPLEVLQSVKRLSPETEVVVMTASSTMEKGLQAIGGGAYDYLTKPFQPQELILVARRALERKVLMNKVRVLEEMVRGRPSFEGIVGSSRALSGVLRMVDQVARLDSTVLISGEAGTGKELIARALHALSRRRENPLVVINCGAIPENLQDREIFGHTEGDLGGASSNQRGLFEEAHGGTAFLDEVTELSLAAQSRMLRLLQNGEVQRVGTPVSRNLDVRIIAATKGDLEKCVEERTFREDLYYRLNVISIQVPALRERTEDIPLLAQHFLKTTAGKLGNPQPAISPRAMSVLMAHPWKGNVREMESVIARAVALDRDGVLGLDDLPFADSQTVADRVIDRAKSKSMTLSELEREYILEILTECGGGRKRTAERLGITTATLWRKLKRFEKGV